MCVCGGERGVQYLLFEFSILKAQVENKTKLKNLKENPSHADDMIDDLSWLSIGFSKKVFYFNFFKFLNIIWNS